MPKPTHRYYCWLVDFDKFENGEDVGVSSLQLAADPQQAACWYAEDYDLSYGTEEFSKPLYIATVDKATSLPVLVETNLQEDPFISWWASVPAQQKRDAFTITWAFIQIGLWGQQGVPGVLRARLLLRPKLLATMALGSGTLQIFSGSPVFATAALGDGSRMDFVSGSPMVERLPAENDVQQAHVPLSGAIARRQ